MFDSLKAIKDKALELTAEHSDVVSQGLEKAAEVVDAKTDGKYSEKIDAGVGKAQDFVEGLAEKKNASG
ncbi:MULTISPECIES: antitoxin [unclassified Streptomyces]|uniref:antitoxin n=1 Tax=unclassified Streptomyces TaxID=2593676 RepID=UPI0029671F5A|nr:antitoxin [Streptomyces sp. SJL17-1]